jgi:hypothetical protein
MQLKKLTYIFVLILLGASGLLTGCKTVYDRMKLELSVEQIELYLPLEDEVIEAPIEEEQPIEGGEEEQVGDAFLQTTMFTATVSNVPKDILKRVTYQTTNDGIVAVSLSDEFEGQTEVEVTALRPGRTSLIIKTLEGNKTKEVAILVLKRVENMTLNENYRLAVTVGSSVSVNTAQAIEFYPIDTNQKDVVYSLSEEVEGVSITEAGLITVAEKTVNEVTVVATSVANESLSVSFPVTILEPIKQEDIVVTTQKQLEAYDEWVLGGGLPEEFNLQVSNLLMANNHAVANSGALLVQINSSETYNLVATSSNNDLVEVVETGMQEGMYVVYLKANNLGQASITIKAEIVGYEQYFSERTVEVLVANFASNVSVGGSLTNKNYIVYNNYASLLGREIKVDITPSTAYSKAIKLFVEEEDLHKITIAYSDGTIIPTEEINSTVLPRGMSIFVKANQISTNPDLVLRQQENTVEINFIANSAIGAEVEVSNKAVLELTQGATDLTIPTQLSLQQGLPTSEYPDVAFVVTPQDAVNDVLSIEVENPSVVVVTLQSGNIYKIEGKQAGTSRVFVTTSNGIRKEMLVEVYVPLSEVELQIESPEQNHNIAERIVISTPAQVQQLQSAVMAVGAGIQMNVAKYPSDASIVSVSYSSNNPTIASINNNGYILARAIGEATITVTIQSKVYEDNQTSSIQTTVKSFALKTYVPIKEINLNAMQVELFDQSALGYFDLEKATYQFEVNITPNNATYNQEYIEWVTSSEYITIEDGFVTVRLNGQNPGTSSMIGTITASIKEYSRYYAKTAVITIKRPVKAESITVYDLPEGYIYFDAREGVLNAGTKQVRAQIYPYNATNSNLRYVYVQDAQDEQQTPVFTVSETGLITPVRAGIAKLHIVAEDRYINENEYVLYSEIVVKVADGLTEETALELYSASDVRAIDTQHELGLHYVLANNLDFLNQPFTPIGYIDGIVHAFTGSINGQFRYGQIEKNYQMKGLTFHSTNNAQFVAGFVAQNDGVLKNLKLEFSNWSFSTNNNDAGTIGYFGGATAINNGTLENVSAFVLTTNTATLQIANQTGYVGLLAAQNNGTILNSTSYGTIMVQEQVGVTTHPKLYLGGMVGLNSANAQIVGSFAPANKILGGQGDDTEYSNENVLYQKEGINAYPTIIATALQNTNSATGVAVGYNQGNILNIAADGVVDATYNVGGMVGLNIGVVENSYSASQVSGQVNVGGLIGYATQDLVGGVLLQSYLKNNAVEIYDRKNSYEQADIAIKGRTSVGGLVGLMDAVSLFEYNYVTSYVVREIDENYVGDLVLAYENKTANFIAGGLIGQLTNVTTPLHKNYAKVTIGTIAPPIILNTPSIFAGGLIGSSLGNFTLEHAYSKGSIVLPLQDSYAGTVVGQVGSASAASINYVYSVMQNIVAEISGVTGQIEAGSVVSITNENYLMWDIEASPIWVVDESINEGHPALKNEQGNILINEAPEEVVVFVQEQSITKNTADGSVSFHHLKVDDKKAVVLLQEEPYAIRNLIATTPNSARYYLTTEQTDIIQILEDGSIRTLKEGTATIRVSSVLNKNIYDTFELAVINGFTNFMLSKTQGDNQQKLTLADTLHLKLNESTILYAAYTNAQQAVGSNVGATYTATAGGFTVNNSSLDATLNNLSTHILTAGNTPSSGNILVTVTPHFKVNFGGQSSLVAIANLEVQFYLSIYEGASEITTNMVSATIGLTEELTLEVYVVTDKQDEEITLQYGQLNEDETEYLGNYIDASLISVEQVEDTEENYLYTRYRYTIKASENFLEFNLGSGNFKSAKSGTISFVPNSNSELVSNFNISIAPQDLLRIDMAYYPTGETQIQNGEATYYPRELPSNIISPAQPGILKVNLYPEYANIDYYEIVSSVNTQGQFVSLEQVALMSNIEDGTISNVSYTAVTPAPTGIPYGTKLNLISNSSIENNEITNWFNGSIYVKALISSAVKTGQTFTLTLTGYRVDEFGVPQANLSKQITLIADVLPGITLLYEGERTGYVERGTRVPLELYVSEEYSGVIKAPVASYEYATTDGENELTLKTIDIEEENGQFYLVVGHGVPSGTTIQVTARVERTINGILEEKESTINLQVVNFLVDKITVLNTTQNTMNLYVGERTQLLVDLQSKMWATSWSEDKLDELFGELNHPILPPSEDRIKLNNLKTQIIDEITYLQKMFSRSMNTWYERTGVNLQTKIGLEEASYANYLIYRSFNEAMLEDYAYDGQKDVHLGATKIGSSANLGAQIEYYYDENGALQPVIYQDGEWVKYPQIYQPENMLEAQVSQEDVLKLKTLETGFNLNITANSTEDKPVPIYNEQDFANMQAGIDYILLSDEPLVLENWVPVNTAIRSLDGNNRIIKLKSFAANTQQGNYNFGLFGTVQEDTVLKNIQLDVSELVLAGGQIDASEYSEINFGFIAGVNNGTINNADVFNMANTTTKVTINTQTSATITYGTLVAKNMGGYITNSRVGRIDAAQNTYPMSIQVQGITGAFIGYNNGVVTSSYAANITLENTSITLQASKTGGFVAVNANSGRISQSFVEGIESSLGEAQDTMEQKVMQRGGILSIGNIGGFVFENQGEITDSYSNIPVITESRSAGFVYRNMASGSITNAYSMSKITERSLAHLPFVGNNSLEEVLNEGQLKNTYYLANENYFTSQFGEDYPAISVSDFSFASNFNGFGFLNETGYQKFGTWEISSQYPRPVLPSANTVTTSQRILVDTKMIGGEIVDYFYTDADYYYERGSEYNPILVATASQFLEAMTSAEYRDPSTKINTNYVRLIKDIDFNEILSLDETNEQVDEEDRLQLINLQNTIYAGKLDGNGMTLQNVRVLSYIYTQESFGMFNQLGLKDADYLASGNDESSDENKIKAVVKNLNIEVAEISATEAVSVGVLAGEILNSIVLNVNVTGQNITLQGKNLVGGLAGFISGDSRVINVSSSLSISSEYRTTQLNDDLVSIDYNYYNEYGTLKSEVSYAGGIAGVIDVYTFDEFGEKQTSINWEFENAKISGLLVDGNITIRGEKTGGVVGYVGPFTYVRDALFEINHLVGIGNQALIGADLVGGVVAENAGLLDHTRVEHETTYQIKTIDKTPPRQIVGYQNLIQENANYAGGLVGYNNMGTIWDSYSRLDISNANLSTVGGLVGVMYGGEINRAYATGHLKAQNIIGGLIGELNNESLQLVDENGLDTGKIASIVNAFAINNWQVSAFYNVNKDEVDENLNGAWLENAAVDENKFIGAFIGSVYSEDALTTILRSWYVNEVFSVTSSTPTPQQTKQLREVGNIVGQTEDGLSAVTTENNTQFETITNLNLVSTQTKYSEFVEFDNPEDSIWTLNSERFPQLRFNNVSDIRQVSTEAQLISTINNYPSSTIIVLNDITLTENWNPQEFRGSLIGKETDGVFPTIYNLNMNNNLQDTGFFSILNSATISNLNFVVGGGAWDGNVNGIVSSSTVENSTMGILAGNINNSSVKNVTILFDSGTTSFVSSAHYTGLLAGKAKNVIIENVTLQAKQQEDRVSLTVTEQTEPDNYENSYVGGVFGQVKGGIIDTLTLQQLEVEIYTNSTLYYGGFAGEFTAGQNVSEVQIDVNAEVFATGTQKDHFIGGFVGSGVNITATQIEVSGAIAAAKAQTLLMGGVAGQLENSKLNYVSYNNVVSQALTSKETTDYVKLGGLVGFAQNVLVQNSSAEGSVLLENAQTTVYVGGLIGHLRNDNTSQEEGFGVILSYAKTSIKTSNAGGGFTYAGGFIGSTANSSYTIEISEVYSQGTLEVSSLSAVRAGGLIGVNTVKVNNVISATRVFVNSNSSQEVGGLVGNSSQNITDAYVYGTVYSNKVVASDAYSLVVNPIVGKLYSGVSTTRVYFNKDIIGLTERTQYEGLLENARPNKSHNELLTLTVAGQEDTFIKSAGTYAYLKNVPAPNLSAGSLFHAILVSDEFDLANIKNDSEYFVQTANINNYGIGYFGQITNFDGVYNGNGYTITYLQSASSGEVGLFNSLSKYGLLAKVGVIANLQLSYNASNEYDVGGLVVNNSGSIYKSYANTTVTVTGASENDKKLRAITFGGLVANNYNLIENSFAKVQLNATVEADTPSYFGGLAGKSADLDGNVSMVNTSFATGEIKLDTTKFTYEEIEDPGLPGGPVIDPGNDGLLITNIYVGGLLGRLYAASLYNSYASTVITEESALQTYGLYGTNTGLDTTISNSYYDMFALEIRKVIATETAKTTKEMANEQFINTLLGSFLSGVWNIDKTQNYGYPYPHYYNEDEHEVMSTGDGTYEKPYLITHAGRLDWVRTQLTSAAYFKQTGNITLVVFNAVNSQFMPIGSVVTETTTQYGLGTVADFIGIYDGQNYEIKNLRQTFNSSSSVYSGLFKTLSGLGSYRYGYVYNTHLTNVNISVASTASITNTYLGGIAGSMLNAKITNSSVSGILNDNRNNNATYNLYQGGLVGYAEQSDITSVYARVTMKASVSTSYIGGLIGIVYDSTIINAYTTNSLTLTSTSSNTKEYRLGGVIGYAEGAVLYNISSSKAITIDAIGITSESGSIIIDTTRTPTNQGTAGVVGHMNGGSITHATNTGIISFKGYNASLNALAGVVALGQNITKFETLKNEGHITATYATGTGINTPTIIGGVLGYVETSSTSTVNIQYIANTGDITANIPESYYASRTKLLYVGGVIGYSNEENYPLSYSYNAGNIATTGSLQANIGGLAGLLNSNITNSYNEGHVVFNSYQSVAGAVPISPKVYVGGIVGIIPTSLKQIINTYNTNNITVIRNDDNYLLSDKFLDLYVGGIAGKVTYSSLEKVYNSGTIKGHINYENDNHELYVGGLIALAEGNSGSQRVTITNSYNIGNIESYIRENSQAAQDIGGVALLGGIVAEAKDVTLQNVYNSALIIKNGPGYYELYGYFVGYPSGLIHNNSYYDALQAGTNGYPSQTAQSIANTARTTTELQQQVTYNGWDFTYTWRIIAGETPSLRSMPTNINLNSGATPEPFVVLQDLPQDTQAVPKVTLSAPTGSGGTTPRPPIEQPIFVA